MTVLYVLAAACVLMGIPTSALRNESKEKARFICKMIGAFLFLLVAFLAAAMREAMNRQAALMLGALMLGAVGDIVLGLDVFVDKRHKNRMLLLGGIPFFLGHVLYIVLLLSYGNIRWYLLGVLPLVPLVFLLLNRMKLLDLGSMKIPLLMYGMVLGAMMLATLNLAMQGGELGRWMWHPGVLFTISDATLFMGQFGTEKLRKAKPVFSYTVMVPYFAAQATFALTVLWL